MIPIQVRDRRWWPLAVGLLATLLFRLPPLLNARGVHSDAAIVGLQAMHALEGEFSRFLWGAGYQGSFDALVIAAVFLLTGGPSALGLMVAPLLGHLLLMASAFAILRRRVGAVAAGALGLLVTFTPQAINGVALYAPRQWCITSLFLALWLLNRANESKRQLWHYAGAAVALVASLYMDLYGLQLLAGVGLFALLTIVSGGVFRRQTLRRLAVFGGTFALALAVLWWARQVPVASTSQTRLSLERVPHNLALLWDTCLPWLLGYKVFVPGASLYPAVWQGPAAVTWFARGAAALLALGFLAAFGLLFSRRVAWTVKRLALLGLAVTASSLGGFLVSTMPSDMWSTRYLAPILWTAPFTLAPLAAVLSPGRLLTGLTPYVAVAALGGWLSYGPYVDGWRPRRDARGVAEEEAQVAEVLRARGVTAAAAQYWLSYRLSFLWEERPVVVPLNPGEDRYPPHQAQLAQAEVVAWIFHPSEPRAVPAQVEGPLRAQGQRYERLEVAGFTVILLDRRR